ncbi:hypothetical protein DFS34DRAFT_222874 [Phlyctochytrium arcticum]|nr:hypothetical protein DFS34DRAFT_222874 [Phlyctochytrium arcticum]
MDAELRRIQARQTLKTAGQALRTVSLSGSLEKVSDVGLSLMTGTTVGKVGGYVGHLTDKILSSGDGGDGEAKSTTMSGDSSTARMRGTTYGNERSVILLNHHPSSFRELRGGDATPSCALLHAHPRPKQDITVGIIKKRGALRCGHLRRKAKGTRPEA